MLPKKIIIAIIIASLALIGREGLNVSQAEKAPNLLLGFGVVGAMSAYQALKEIAQPL